MKLKTLLLIPTFALLSGVWSAYAGPSQKPLPPLKISIAPAESGITSADIKPGDIVSLQVTASSAINAPEMQIEVTLSRGAQLISGDTFWKGSANKGGNTVINFTVQAPQKGTGRVKARVVIPASKGQFSAEAIYNLGPVSHKSQRGTVKKDSKGRSIIEYR